MLLLLLLTVVAFQVELVVSLSEGERVNGTLGYSIEVCTGPEECRRENTGLVLAYEFRNCPDPRTCNNVPSYDEMYNSFGVYTVNNTELHFNYQPYTARMYMTAGDGSDRYQMFELLNKELRFDVELSAWSCGLNAALYFVVMPEDGGKAESGYAGPTFGTGYCDAQAPKPPYQPSCVEMDVWESNSLANALTTHGCDPQGYCDPAGCGFNPYGLGDTAFYGRGPDNQVDTTLPFSVITRFVTVDGTDTGDLKEIQRLYVQNGRIIPNPSFEGYSSVSDSYCEHFGKSNIGGISSSMSQAMRKKMVMVMSWWGDFEDQEMWWLDTPPNGPCPSYTNRQGYFSFSNIKIGPIGSTF